MKRKLIAAVISVLLSVLILLSAVSVGFTEEVISPDEVSITESGTSADAAVPSVSVEGELTLPGEENQIPASSDTDENASDIESPDDMDVPSTTSPVPTEGSFVIELPAADTLPASTVPGCNAYILVGQTRQYGDFVDFIREYRGQEMTIYLYTYLPETFLSGIYLSNVMEIIRVVLDYNAPSDDRPIFSNTALDGTKSDRGIYFRIEKADFSPVMPSSADLENDEPVVEIFSDHSEPDDNGSVVQIDQTVSENEDEQEEVVVFGTEETTISPDTKESENSLPTIEIPGEEPAPEFDESTDNINIPDITIVLTEVDDQDIIEDESGFTGGDPAEIKDNPITNDHLPAKDDQVMQAEALQMNGTGSDVPDSLSDDIQIMSISSPSEQIIEIPFDPVSSGNEAEACNENGERGSVQDLLESGSNRITLFVDNASFESPPSGVAFTYDRSLGTDLVAEVQRTSTGYTVSAVQESNEKTFTVQPNSDYVANTWTNRAPSFVLSTVQNIGPDESFIYYVDGEGPYTIEESPFQPAKIGKHTYEFGFQNSSQVIIMASESYPVWYDRKAPEIKSIQAAGRAILVTAQDDFCDVLYVSFDNGLTWAEMKNGSYQKSFTQNTECKICVRDQAGNISPVAKATVVVGGKNGNSAANAMSIMNRKSGTSSARTISHASGDNEEASLYDVLEQSSHSAVSMQQLGMGSADLILVNSSGEKLKFSSELLRWNSKSKTGFSASSGIFGDTLLLTSLSEDSSGSWKFNGNAYRKLKQCGIDHLVLKIGENVTAFSTDGFTAGLKFDQLKAGGLPNKSFAYTLTMGSDAGALQMTLEVEGDTYLLTSNKTLDFYYFNVYSGKPEGLNLVYNDTTEEQG